MNNMDPSGIIDSSNIDSLLEHLNNNNNDVGLYIEDGRFKASTLANAITKMMYDEKDLKPEEGGNCL